LNEYEAQEIEKEKILLSKETRLEGKTVVLEEIVEDEESDLNLTEGGWLFNQRALQDYLLVCCQENTGGFRDKPTKNRDFYHTCYSLSGLSLSQHSPNSLPIIEGDYSNIIKETDFLHNVTIEKVIKASNYFKAII